MKVIGSNGRSNGSNTGSSEHVLPMIHNRRVAERVAARRKQTGAHFASLRSMVWLFGTSTLILFFALMVAISILIDTAQNCGRGDSTPRATVGPGHLQKESATVRSHALLEVMSDSNPNPINSSLIDDAIVFENPDMISQAHLQPETARSRRPEKESPLSIAQRLRKQARPGEQIRSISAEAITAGIDLAYQDTDSYVSEHELRSRKRMRTGWRNQTELGDWLEAHEPGDVKKQVVGSIEIPTKQLDDAAQARGGLAVNPDLVQLAPPQPSAHKEQMQRNQTDVDLASTVHRSEGADGSGSMPSPNTGETQLEAVNNGSSDGVEPAIAHNTIDKVTVNFLSAEIVDDPVIAWLKTISAEDYLADLNAQLQLEALKSFPVLPKNELDEVSVTQAIITRLPTFAFAAAFRSVKWDESVDDRGILSRLAWSLLNMRCSTVIASHRELMLGTLESHVEDGRLDHALEEVYALFLAQGSNAYHHDVMAKNLHRSLAVCVDMTINTPKFYKTIDDETDPMTQLKKMAQQHHTKRYPQTNLVTDLLDAYMFQRKPPTLAQMDALEAHPSAVRLSDSPRVVQFQNFATAEECDKLMELSKKSMRRSQVVAGEGRSSIDKARTSSGASLSKFMDPLVGVVQERIANVTGLPEAHSEPFQVLKYENGQEYKQHFDYCRTWNSKGELDPYGCRPFFGHSTDRIGTFILILNAAEEGGYTFFPRTSNSTWQLVQAGRKTPCSDPSTLRVRPPKGDGLFFWDYKPNGIEDEMSEHGGCPVTEGEKWIMTRWIRGSTF
mmetsp:Transcript_7673/g.28262  ORF Transcript_7673/g.28262 Transcript_7673/m.28262 type:complete len:784 (-) Transcript_7673:2192-4543(-)